MFKLVTKEASPVFSHALCQNFCENLWGKLQRLGWSWVFLLVECTATRVSPASFLLNLLEFFNLTIINDVPSAVCVND